MTLVPFFLWTSTKLSIVNFGVVPNVVGQLYRQAPLLCNLEMLQTMDKKIRDISLVSVRSKHMQISGWTDKHLHFAKSLTCTYLFITVESFHLHGTQPGLT